MFLLPFELKIDTPLTHAEGNVYANFDFSAFLCVRVTSPYGTDRRTDRRMWKMRQLAYRTIDILIFNDIGKETLLSISLFFTSNFNQFITSLRPLAHVK